MRSRWLIGLIVFLLLSRSLLAFEVRAVLRKVDADRRILVVLGGDKERTVKVDKNAKFLDDKGQPLPGGIKSKELRDGIAVTLTVELEGNEPIVLALQLAGKKSAAAPPAAGRSSVGFKPLTEMTADDKYKGEDGGLYGGGKNEPPTAHRAAARNETAKIVPRAADGEPSKQGTIALVSISMSNATQVFSTFKKIADADPQKSPQLAIVDCAQGGQAMAEWVDPKAPAWAEADRRLAIAKVSPKQVQVAWIKLANKVPSGDLPQHGKKLQKDTLAVLRNAKARFPNLRIVYLGSRTYAGWSVGNLNPEPYAYESAFVVRWLIQDQIKGAPGLNYDSGRGLTEAALLLWGPYLWTDGTTPRKADGLIWERNDVAADGVHPSPSGRQKAATQLLSFFKNDADARRWFVQP